MNDAIEVTGADCTLVPETEYRLGDFPFVFLSYDEPWADDHWRDLKKKVPHAVRVHGVKGLDACHKAAADAVPGEWLVTIDADTVIDPGFPDIRVPNHLLRDCYRLDWLSLNTVNGLWTGNGSVKLWPKRILREMRTHEAAPSDQISIDHDIGNVVPGQSGQLTMPERAAKTQPALTAYHAFRAGFRETIFLRSMAVGDAQRMSLPNWQDAGAVRALRIWCSIGRHAENGLWALYGARLGLLFPDIQPDWDPRSVNEYTWLDDIWHHQVAPRFSVGVLGQDAWNWARLDDETRNLANQIGAELGIEICEYSSASSQLIAEANLFSATAAASRHDALGYRLMVSENSIHAQEAARRYFEVARTLDHTTAYDNLGSIHQKSRISGASIDEAAWNFRAAVALGSGFAPAHIEELESHAKGASKKIEFRPAIRADKLPLIRLYDPSVDLADKKTPGTWVAVDKPAALPKALKAMGAEHCLIFDPGVEPALYLERHVPDPALCPSGQAIGYSSLCLATARVLPLGVRFASVETFLADGTIAPAAVLPTVLGARAAPFSVAAAIRTARADVESGTVMPAFATLGRDVDFGDVYVYAILLQLLDEYPGDEVVELEAQGEPDQAQNISELCARLEGVIGCPVPVWTAQEGRNLKVMLPHLAQKTSWLAAADAFESLGLVGNSQSDILKRTARAVWGKD